MPEETPTLQNGSLQTRRHMRCRTGCLTCRRRKKKCDESQPSCAGCRRNNLECEWESSDSLSKPRRRHRQPRSYDNSLPEQVQRMMKVFFVLTPDIICRLLGHFLDSSPKWMSTRIGSRRTDYLKWLSPAISESPLVLNCTLAIASADLVKYHRGNKEMYQVAVEYYGKAVSSLRVAIENEMAIASPSDTSLPDYTPLAVLLLCVHETQNFTQSERILPHLNAAVFLLQNRIFRQSTNIGLRSFLFEMFCYFFALASFSLGTRLPLSRAYCIFNSPSVAQHIQRGHIMGTSQHLFIAIYQISSLGLKLASSDLNEISAARSELSSLDYNLSCVETKPGSDYKKDPELHNDAVTSELYRLACRIHIQRLLVSSIPDEDPSILTLVEEFVNQLRLLPSNSPSHSILSWPLVVAGFSAKSTLHQRMIVGKLTQIYDEWQSDIFSKGAAYLQEKWRKEKGLNQSPSDNSTFHQSLDDIGTVWKNCPVILA